MMKLKVQKLSASVVHRIVASLVAGGLVLCTGTFVLAASKTVNSSNYEGGSIKGNSGDTDSQIII